MGRVPKVQRPADGAAMIAQHATRLREVEAQQVAAGGGGGGGTIVPYGVESRALTHGEGATFDLDKTGYFETMGLYSWTLKAAISTLGDRSIVQINGKMTLTELPTNGPGGGQMVTLGIFNRGANEPSLPFPKEGWQAPCRLETRVGSKTGGEQEWIPAVLQCSRLTANAAQLSIFYFCPAGRVPAQVTDVELSVAYVADESYPTSTSFVASAGGGGGASYASRTRRKISVGDAAWEIDESAGFVPTFGFVSLTTTWTPISASRKVGIAHLEVSRVSISPNSPGSQPGWASGNGPSYFQIGTFDLGPQYEPDFDGAAQAGQEYPGMVAVWRHGFYGSGDPSEAPRFGDVQLSRAESEPGKITLDGSALMPSAYRAYPVGFVVSASLTWPTVESDL